MATTLAERLQGRIKQLGLNPGRLAELAGVNRSFIYDILRGRSENPTLERLAKIAAVLKVEPSWLTSGLGEIEGPPPNLDDPTMTYVPVPFVAIRASMGGGAQIEEETLEPGQPFTFQQSWIQRDLRASPERLRLLRVEGDSMMPTLMDSDVVLVDTGKRAPTPPGIFVLHDGFGLVAKRLEHIPMSDPPRVRVISDNERYSPYECTAEEINIVGRVRWFSREL